LVNYIHNILDETTGLILPWFDKSKLTLLEIIQAVGWDESNWKCIAGQDDFNAGNHGGYIIWFPRDNTGKLDLDNGTYDESEVSPLKMKYDKENVDVPSWLSCASGRW
jgi:hypothetical protein